MSSGEIFCMSDTSLSLSITYYLCVELLTELNRPIKCFLHISAISEEPVQPLTVFARGAFLLLSALTFLKNSPCYLFRSFRAIASAFIESPFLKQSLNFSFNLAREEFISSYSRP